MESTACTALQLFRHPEGNEGWHLLRRCLQDLRMRAGRCPNDCGVLVLENALNRHCPVCGFHDRSDKPISVNRGAIYLTRTINIAAEFSRFPGGRYITDGRYSGEAFRETMLLPLLRSNARVNVLLDGTLGYGVSFLEEAFGGLVRAVGGDTELLSRLHLVSADRSRLELLQAIMQRAMSPAYA